MRQQIEDFLKSLRDEEGYADNTIVAYGNDLGQFARFLTDQLATTSWDSVSKKDLDAYVSYLRNEREYASATVARKVAATKSFFHYLVNVEALTDDPTATLESPKVRRYLPTSISEEDVARLLRAPEGHNTSRAVRDSALLELLYATGMRVSEVVDLNEEDVDLEDCQVQCTNRNRRRRIPLHRRAVRALRDYLEGGRLKLLRDESETALFLNHRGRRLTRQGLWLIMKKYVEEVGIDAHVTPHTLRHSFATHLLRGGADVREVQGLLGHANVSTTQVYTQISDQKLREIYEEAHPRAH
ncbi:MAG TPA: site-specific tyrosine recombinase/integron integrase [Anaerolineae bacterium]|nr:site-specific tyrosine recombinase/integron integrase [Anaerolineae bacterium]